MELTNLKENEQIDARIISIDSNSNVFSDGRLIELKSVKIDLKNERALIGFITEDFSRNYSISIFRNGILLEERVYRSSGSNINLKLIKFPTKAFVEELSNFEIEILNNNYAIMESIQNRLNVQIFGIFFV